MTEHDKHVFEEVLHALAASCNVAQFRCELFDESGEEEGVIARGMDACMMEVRNFGDGRCGPGGAAALLRSMAMLMSGSDPAAFAGALRNAADVRHRRTIRADVPKSGLIVVSSRRSTLHMNKKHSGARSELIACAWLLTEGYEVFRNISQHGYVDIIALKGGKTFYFDVRTVYENGRTRLSHNQIEMGVLPLMVTQSGVCSIDFEPVKTASKPNGRYEARGKSVKPEVLNCRECGELLHGDYRFKSGGSGLRPRGFCSYGCSGKFYDRSSRALWRARGAKLRQGRSRSP